MEVMGIGASQHIPLVREENECPYPIDSSISEIMSTYLELYGEKMTDIHTALMAELLYVTRCRSFLREEGVKAGTNGKLYSSYTDYEFAVEKRLIGYDHQDLSIDRRERIKASRLLAQLMQEWKEINEIVRSCAKKYPIDFMRRYWCGEHYEIDCHITHSTFKAIVDANKPISVGIILCAPKNRRISVRSTSYQPKISGTPNDVYEPNARISMSTLLTMSQPYMKLNKEHSATLAIKDIYPIGWSQHSASKLRYLVER